MNIDDIIDSHMTVTDPLLRTAIRDVCLLVADAEREAAEALLRQALEALEDAPYMSNGEDQVVWSEAVFALRKRLGEKA